MPEIGKSKSKLFLILGIIIIIVLYIIFTKAQNISLFTNANEQAIKNYKSQVDLYADKYNLPSSYLMALIMLECSGRKAVTPRFEKKIYKQLLDLKNKKIDHFEDLTPIDLKYYSDNDIKKLANSYGPFQIMGYKTIKMNITIEELYGKNAIKYGAYWIDKEYGDLLRQGRFADAFHFHNTGKIIPSDGIPRTYDPRYVRRGIDYMRYFSKNQ